MASLTCITCIFELLDNLANRATGKNCIWRIIENGKLLTALTTWNQKMLAHLIRWKKLRRSNFLNLDGRIFSLMAMVKSNIGLCLFVAHDSNSGVLNKSLQVKWALVDKDGKRVKMLAWVTICGQTVFPGCQKFTLTFKSTVKTQSDTACGLSMLKNFPYIFQSIINVQTIFIREVCQ